MAGTRSRTAQQLTYLLPGAALSAWLGTPHALLALARDGGAGWAQCVSYSQILLRSNRVGRDAARVSIGAGVLVVGLFLYVLFYPALKGVGQPNVCASLVLVCGSLRAHAGASTASGGRTASCRL
jgi:hypothetical protein